MRTDFIELARQVLDEYRAGLNTGGKDVVSLPAAAWPNLAQAIAQAPKTLVRQVVPIVSDEIRSCDFDFQFWREVARLGCRVERIYVLPHTGFARAAISEAIALDADCKVQSKVVALSQVPQDIEVGRISFLTIVDDDVVFRRPERPSISSLISGSRRPQELAEGVSLWRSLELIADQSGAADSVDLEEPLVSSADLLAAIADVLCSGDHVDPKGCSWYHGTWQYLRLFDLVSTPSWHNDFYLAQLVEAFRESPNKVLISGTADYSMLAYVAHAACSADVEVKVTVLDKCPTPLFAARWYSRRFGIEANALEADLFDLDQQPEEFDLVCTDAFLTRFDLPAAKKVLETWHTILKPGGRIVTTVRLHPRTTVVRDHQQAVADFRDKAQTRGRRWSPFLRTPLPEIVSCAEFYAQTMRSESLGDEQDVVDLFRTASFEVLVADSASVPGELYPTVYLRIACRKGGN